MIYKTAVISLGGSIIVPDQVDGSFLKKFREIIVSLQGERFVIICGGGRVCRNYQNAARELAAVSNEDLDWIGIAATRLNAELVRTLFAGNEANRKVIHDPLEEIDENKRIVIGAGFQARQFNGPAGRSVGETFWGVQGHQYVQYRLRIQRRPEKRPCCEKTGRNILARIPKAGG